MKMARRFRPVWWSIPLTLFGLALFVSLGIWQLDRAAFKDSLRQKFEQRLAEDYRSLRLETDLADPQYRRFRFVGRYDERRHFLLDNQVHQGRAGYQVITPFYLADSDRILLVNRGWAPWGESRAQLPQVMPPALAEEASGIAFVPGEPALALGRIEVGDDWPQLLPYVDIEALRQQYSPRLLPMVLWLAPEQPGVYVRDWDPIWLPPEKSRAYAVQWFSFAVVALILFVVLNLRKSE